MIRMVNTQSAYNSAAFSSDNTTSFSFGDGQPFSPINSITKTCPRKMTGSGTTTPPCLNLEQEKDRSVMKKRAVKWKKFLPGQISHLFFRPGAHHFARIVATVAVAPTKFPAHVFIAVFECQDGRFVNLRTKIRNYPKTFREKIGKSEEFDIDSFFIWLIYSIAHKIHKPLQNSNHWLIDWTAHKSRSICKTVMIDWLIAWLIQ